MLFDLGVRADQTDPRLMMMMMVMMMVVVID